MELEVSIPNGWNEITISQYRDIVSLPDDMSEEERQNKILTIVCGVPEKLLESIPVADRTMIITKLNEAINKEPKFIRRFHHRGIEYGFIPNLDDITFGEWIDLEKYQGEMTKVHHLISILYRPIIEVSGDRYAIRPYDTKQMIPDVDDISAEILVGASVFFYRLGIESSMSILKYSHERKTKRKRRRFRGLMNRNGSRTNGDGISQSIDFVREISGELIRSQHSPHIKYFCGCLLRAIGLNS